MVVESLQTLCTSALRLYYTTPPTTLTGVSSSDGSSVTRRTVTPRTTPIPMIDRRAIKVFFESLDVEDNPTLQIESARALTDIFDRLTEEDEQDDVEDEAIPVLINLLDSNDEATRDKASAVVRGLVTGHCDLRRDLVLRQLVEGLRGDDNEEQDIYSYWLALILNMDDPCPDIVQRVVVDTGILPRFAQLFRSRHDAYFQREAVCSFSAVLRHGDPDAITAMVVDEGVIPALVRVLRNHHDDDDELVKFYYSVLAIRGMAHRLPLCRDVIVQSGAVAALLDLIQSKTYPLLIKDGAWALDAIFASLPSPDFSALRPLVPALVRLLSRPEVCVMAMACQALVCLTDEDDTEGHEVVQAVVEAGAGRHLVELLRHPRPVVHTPALAVVGNIVLGTDLQLQAIMEHQPLESLAALLSSPDGLIRGNCCWVIGNLASESQERIEQLIEHGIFPALVRCLSDPDVDQREFAARAVGEAIAPSGTPRQVQALVEAGCLSPLCDLLATNFGVDDHRVPSYALEGIENALAAGETFRDDDGNDDDDDNDNDRSAGPKTNPVAARIASDSGDGLDKIRGLLRHPNDDLRARASLVLTTYFGSDPGAARAGSKRRRRRRSE